MSTIAVIQARLGSSRMPRKALAELAGKTVIEHVVERVGQIRGVDDYVLAVPNGEIRELSYCHHVWAPPVPENDVLARFATCINEFPECDTVVRVTGDCPMLEPDVCDHLIENWRGLGFCEYGWVNTHDGGWPDGLDCEIFTRELLMQAHQQATDPDDRQHVTSWMRRNATVYSLPPDLKYRDWPKVSIDTPEDLERVRELMVIRP